MTENPGPDRGPTARGARPTVVGRVVSSKMKDTIVVTEQRLEKHPTYGKYVRKKSRFVAHDAGNTAKEGDEVEIMQTRPLSKTQNWRLVRIVRRSQGGVLHADTDVASVTRASPTAGPDVAASEAAMGESRS